MDSGLLLISYHSNDITEIVLLWCKTTTNKPYVIEGIWGRRDRRGMGYSGMGYSGYGIERYGGRGWREWG